MIIERYGSGYILRLPFVEKLAGRVSVVFYGNTRADCLVYAFSFLSRKVNIIWSKRSFWEP